MTIVSSGTITAFAAKGDRSTRLRSALIFENLYFILVSLGFLIAKSGDFVHLPGALAPLLIVAALRVNNQIFSRYLMFYDNLKRSLLNDLLGNYLWMGAWIGWTLLDPNNDPSSFIWIWISFLALNVFRSLYRFRSHILGTIAWKDVTSFLSTYLNSFHFNIVSKLFGTVEKVILIDKIEEKAPLAGYLMASKFVGFGSELTGGFMSSVVANDLHALKDGDDRRYFTKVLLLSVLLFSTLAAGTWIFSDLIQWILKAQLEKQYSPLLVLVVPLYGLNYMHSVIGLYFQRVGFLRLMQFQALLQVILLGCLYILKLDIYHFLFVEISGFVILLSIDLTALYLQRKRRHDS
jgi:hypothetical protein